ncbi:GDP-L-fucose synthase [Pseudohalioglobus sediminis]|uniref:GDP-L-fucose synthase n=1 Tax=Pseudohalioglobus sediminis TaxID=2606449 RepID=A0A5B0WR51_9GAMM|nr:GDP-L-fucose synthase [Pseudohalioglobus sediminis]KAA1188928.1 GDP-L-fucose synthase [Pseudohalioglobus sediminis]
MSKRIFVAGHRGMVGAALVRQLQQQSGNEIITRSRAELDLTNQQAVQQFFAGEQIDEVYLAAAKVGGIHANDTYPADFIYDNLMLEANVIHQAFAHGVNKLLFLGSSCIYPRLAEQPMSEDALLTGTLEPTNEPYALAKIAGIKLCESYNRQHDTDYRSVMPTNLYGPGDNFHPENSHVIPALLRRFHEAVQSGASSITIWGTGKPLREFLHVDDMARASVHVMNLPQEEYAAVTQPRLSHINVGSGVDCSIAELAETIGKVTGFTGTIDYDISKPDGAPRKLMDNSKLRALGWQPEYNLQAGLADAYRWYLEHLDTART